MKCHCYPESCKQETTAKHLSLMNAAVEVLRRSEQPLNTREIAAQAIVLGLWTANRRENALEQTLYGAIFREMATRNSRASSRPGRRANSACVMLKIYIAPQPTKFST